MSFQALLDGFKNSFTPSLDFSSPTWITSHPYHFSHSLSHLFEKTEDHSIL